MKINARPKAKKYGPPDGEYDDAQYRAHKMFCYNNKTYYTWPDYVKARDTSNENRVSRFNLTRDVILTNADLAPRSMTNREKDILAQREFVRKFAAKCLALGLYPKAHNDSSN